MPKLKKHSQMHLDISEDKSSNHEKEIAETEADENVEESNSFVPSRMKCSDRIKLFEQEAKKKKERKSRKKKESTVEKPSEQDQSREDSQINKFLSKYSDQDDFAVDEERRTRLKRKSQKANKPEIKTKNKMFADVNFEQTDEEQKFVESQQLQLSVEKKERRESNQLLTKFQQKADFCKNKLDYKDLNKDHRYRKNMTEKLKEIKEVEEVNIVVQVPKIFGGNRSQIETALFLKNATEKDTQQLTDLNKEKEKKEKQDDENTVNMDRKTYYDDLGKQLRMKKAETFTQSVLKDRFKKSKLEDEDFIHDFRDKNGTNSISQLSQGSYSHQKWNQSKKECRLKRYSEGVADDSNRNSLSVQRSSLGTNRASGILLSKQKPEDIPENEEISSIIAPSEKIFSKDNENTVQSGSKDVLSEIVYKQAKPQNIKKKIKEFKYKNYIEVEAEISDDEEEGGPKHKDDKESDIDQDTNLHSMIDDDVEINAKDQQNVHKKFIKDMIEMEEKKYQQMKKEMEKKYIEEEERMKKRMEEVARKNLERDQMEGKDLYTDAEEEGQNSKSGNTSNSVALNKNMEKLDELQEFLNGEKKTEKQKKKEPEIQVIKKLDALQKAIMGENPKAFKKAERKGMKSVNAHKKPIKIKGKQ